jgi:hypothetical protein
MLDASYDQFEGPEVMRRVEKLLNGGSSIKGGYDPKKMWKIVSHFYRLKTHMRYEVSYPNYSALDLLVVLLSRTEPSYDRSQILDGINYASQHGLLRGHYAELQQFATA